VLAADRSPLQAQGGKVIVEHTNINPTRPRTSATSGTPCWRTHCAQPQTLGRRVEIQNYIDHTAFSGDLCRLSRVRGRIWRGAAKYDAAALPRARLRLTTAWDLYAEVTRF